MTRVLYRRIEALIHVDVGADEQPRSRNPGRDPGSARASVGPHTRMAAMLTAGKGPGKEPGKTVAHGGAEATRGPSAVAPGQAQGQ